MTWREFDYADRAALNAACAERLQAAADAARERRGIACLAIAGGSTPLPAYRQWAVNGKIDSRVRITPTDERWVAASDPACNLTQLQACFDPQQSPQWYPLVPRDPAPVPDLGTAQRSLSQLDGRFDAVLLGMGADGHVASLFPGAAELAQGLELPGDGDALVIHPDPLPAEAAYARISLSLSRLLNTQRLLLMISGAAKRDVLRAAQRNPDPLRWPVSALLQATDSVLEIHWSP